MKLQYLGDSRDSFKWDYHDYLTSALGYTKLNILLMLTPDDNSNQGKTAPAIYPSRKPIHDLCCELREQRNIRLIYKLPSATGSKYLIELHKGETYLTNRNRKEYFSGLSTPKRQVLFLDPDNGFEPEKSHSKKHVLYSDIEAIIQQISEESVISVFQYFRRISFTDDFTCIKQRLISGYATAIYWHSLMFVAISKSKDTIDKVLTVNRQYSQGRPVSILQ